jgi:hypothetical protein
VLLREAVLDWSDIQPFVGHVPTAGLLMPLGPLRRLHPAQIADLVEGVSRQQSGRGVLRPQSCLSPYVGVPIAALVLIGISLTGNFRRWERAMFIFRARNLLVFPLALFSHPDPEQVLRGLFIPGIAGGVTSNAVLPVIAIIGTTLAPWQLYFQQSNVLDKRITPRWLAYERADTVIGLAWW